MFDLDVSRHVREDDRFWYCYEDAALETVRIARRMGVPTFYELPIPYFASAHRIYQSEVAEEPELERFFPQLSESEEKRSRKFEEIRCSDTIVCASSFTKRSVEDHFPGKNTVVVRYGFEAAELFASSDRNRDRLRILFAGRLDPRKGLHRLFAALSRLPAGSWSLDLAGRWIPGFEEFLRRRYPSIAFRPLGQLSKAKLREAMLQSDLLVLPSLFEGFGLVLSEAMANGVPVIGTTNTALPDLLGRTEGTGIVRAGSTEELTVELSSLIRDRGLREHYREECLAVARRRSWLEYGAELAHAVAGLPVSAGCGR